MRGRKQAQRQFLAAIDVNARIPEGHALREIKRLSDEVLRRLSDRFEAMYSEIGRPSIPPERLLGARLLAALFSVPSERAFSRTAALRPVVPVVFGPGTGGGTLRREHLQQKPATVIGTPSRRRVLCRSGRLTARTKPVERGTLFSRWDFDRSMGLPEKFPAQGRRGPRAPGRQRLGRFFGPKAQQCHP
jgi:hypothetical protein